MPKVSSTAVQPSFNPLSNKSGHPNTLKRNQACHQCRRRKLKCDAKRPCSTCVRSHAHAVSHAPPGTDVPSQPDCTYDEVPEGNGVSHEVPKNRYERLENRINELEDLLRQKEQAEAQAHRDSSNSVTSREALSQYPSPPNSNPLSSEVSRSRDAASLSPSSFGGNSEADGRSPNPNTIDFAASAPSLGIISPSPYDYGNQLSGISAHISPPLGSGTSSNPLLIGNESSNANHDLIWTVWPPTLPSPDLVRHLVEAFFAYHPHATRLFHAPTFLPSLALPSDHVKFPNPAIIHAICALASLYSAAVSSPHPNNMPEDLSDDIFSERHKRKQGRMDTFAELQAKNARQVIDEQFSMGENLFEIMQARIVLSWYYWAQARWCDVYTSSALSLRGAVTAGLSSCPPFHTIAKTTRPLSIIPRAATVIEDEMRRNAFWLAYAIERLHGCGNGWALSLDDLDVSQLLPVRGDVFQQGSLVLPQERQWSHSRDLFLTHPEDQTDSFVLYIKAVMLLSRIKSFNLRFRARHYAGDPATMSPPPVPGSSAPQRFDPRTTPGFVELDTLAAKFRPSFPREYSDPIIMNTVDPHLYTACLVPYVAIILLHEPHAMVENAACISACKILAAARDILNLIYAITATSYDISLLDIFVTFSWFMAGRVLARFLQAAQSANGQEHIATLSAEILSIRSAIAKMGERVPVAYRYAKMLQDFISQTCGDNFAVPIPALPPRLPLVPLSSDGAAFYDVFLQGDIDALFGPGNDFMAAPIA
ncbi:hypothetical protein JAAARDRAFT_148211 [Jaapia argillacea MUCL 33604]|uniref:Zn(2)-C6 fungal-type domain-containing protein n=1 Tax=Jaapia argillacea MUCL 33604 TaxID=933084 RepID=A0A067Q9L5_9AGAM|nr:hypothetical protein JAAARDRAFT_148211 [Jaapia argillacea MUCL 33604]